MGTPEKIGEIICIKVTASGKVDGTKDFDMHLKARGTYLIFGFIGIFIKLFKW